MGLSNTEKVLEKDMEKFNEYLEENKNQARNAMKKAEVFIYYYKSDHFGHGSITCSIMANRIE